MDNRQDLFRPIEFSHESLPVEVTETETETAGFDMLCHWHNHVQIYQMISGDAVVYCDDTPLRASAGDIVLINKDELHYLESLSGPLKYRIVKIDFSCLEGGAMDESRIQYIEPLLQDRLQFDNFIGGDAELCGCIDGLARECERKRPAWELAVKARLFDLLAMLVRSHMRAVSGEKVAERFLQRNGQFRRVLAYIEDNCAEKIALDSLADMAHMSPEHFCRSFKRLTGRTAVDYINRLRVEKAHALLLRGGCNVSEAAMATGFTDSNYFSRTFKKYKSIPPSGVI